MHDGHPQQTQIVGCFPMYRLITACGAPPTVERSHCGSQASEGEISGTETRFAATSKIALNGLDRAMYSELRIDIIARCWSGALPLHHFAIAGVTAAA